jgi:hypothetical protein
MAEDIVRVLRILEYVGPRSAIERQIADSIQGEKRVRRIDNGRELITIRAATIGMYPEILAANAVIDRLMDETKTEPPAHLATCGHRKREDSGNVCTMIGCRNYMPF